ncbi:MAG: glycoside hydrolase family 140 protein, partial [Bacteroidetes bacterium]|nr:glycoside hydrolase family 140 protein [Bacteroidota bacterium]
ETIRYLDDRQKKGFNVIQVMVLHSLDAVNVYGASALLDRNIATPKTTEGNSPEVAGQYDYWDHIDFVIDAAAARGICIALVPVWGSNIKAGKTTEAQALAYGTFLANRYKSKPNIIWMNGGDIKGGDALAFWNKLGATLHSADPSHIITFHPRGRTSSSAWFQDQPWLYFNSVQSGHRRYEQDTSKGDWNYGEDNWKYIEADYKRTPVRPVLDAEPSYEGIPQGLHDTTQPRWKDSDVRRYGYWSVFAGAAGYTYGDNSVMQMLRPSDKNRAYGATAFWYDAINDPGASQMQYLKQLMLSRPYFERVPDQQLIAAQPGVKYDRLIATRGNHYAFIYTYTGKKFKVTMGRIAGTKVKAGWYDPRTGATTAIGGFVNKGVLEFDPPGEPADGNDWVLVLDSYDSH